MTYRSEFESLYKTSFLGLAADVPLGAAQQASLDQNLDLRPAYFRNAVIPWLRRMLGRDPFRVVEIGSGLGSSTEALAPFAKHICCFEIDKTTLPIAKFRLERLGSKNFDIQTRLFDESAARMLSDIDGVFLPAVLEHTTVEECLDILRNAWSVLNPGGWLCVVDTPNRLQPMDYHTSSLPFFSMLQP